MDHVRGAPLPPQTRGKIERWHQTLRNRILLENDFLPGDLERQIGAFVEHDNHHRYRESLGNLTPAHIHFGRDQAVIERRKRIKEMTIRNRRLRHHSQVAQPQTPMSPILQSQESSPVPFVLTTDTIQVGHADVRRHRHGLLLEVRGGQRLPGHRRPTIEAASHSAARATSARPTMPAWARSPSLPFRSPLAGSTDNNNTVICLSARLDGAH